MAKYDFEGVYNYSIDQRKRVFIPANLRSELGEEFIVFAPLGKSKFLVIYPADEWEKFYENVQNTYTGAMRAKMERYYTSMKKRTSPDKQGRITLTDVLCERAGLTKDALIAGVGNRIEIWSPENWAKEFEDIENLDLDDENLPTL